MITELILSGFFGIADIFLGLFPAADWTIESSAWGALGEYLDMICYLLPLEHIKGIISAIIAISAFRLTTAIIREIMRLIPFFG